VDRCYLVETDNQDIGSSPFMAVVADEDRNGNGQVLMTLLSV
jgi:hypothetical protein